MINFKKFLYENDTIFDGETTIDGKIPHFHTYLINEDGNGSTDKTLPPSTTNLSSITSKHIIDHSHMIKKWKILKSGKDNHIHYFLD